jgi:hypothetical protein
VIDFPGFPYAFPPKSPQATAKVAQQSTMGAKTHTDWEKVPNHNFPQCSPSL